MNLNSILTSLKEQPRPLSDEEDLYLQALGLELKRAATDAARWRILKREGLASTEGFNFDEEVLRKLGEFRKAALS